MCSFEQSLLTRIAEFLRDNPEDEWDETWWEGVVPYLPYKDAVAACELYVVLSNAYADIEDKERGLIGTNDDGLTTYRLAKEKIHEILNRPQVTQRTEEWYKEGLEQLTGSQFSQIFASPRTRGLLVLQKAGLLEAERRSNRLCCESQYMTPFDWGIRFEPVVRTIYSALTSTTVADVGRLRHRTLKNLAASPDGLVIEESAVVGPSPRLGRLVEYKAPVTRKLVQKIPSEYMMQMQIQMEVADIDTCDYCEMKFYSAYGDKMREPYAGPNPHYRGYVGLVLRDGALDRYAYSPLNVAADWDDWALEENERILEKIEWVLEDYYIHSVGRDRAWFAGVVPAIDAFWADVAAAKEGRFVLAEKKVTTASKRKAGVVLSIVDDQDDDDEPMTTGISPPNSATLKSDDQDTL
jgi:hypothetical protein